jgi:Protein of unknown function (DUF3592)
MNSLTVFIFRILLVVGGFILMYIIGKPVVETIQYRAVGEHSEGRIIGFRGRGSSTSVFDENTGKSGSKHRSRRPVYRYPVTEGSLDSLDGYSKSTIIIPWMNFELNEKVTVVFDKSEPSKSHIFSMGIIFTDTLLLLLCLYMVKLGVTRRDS